MREQLPEFETRGVALACVVQGTPEDTARFCGRHGLAQKCVPDPERESYRAMGLPNCKVRDIVFASPEMRRRRKEAFSAGHFPNIQGALLERSGWLQLPGAALVAHGGKILWLHRAKHVGDLPSAEELRNLVIEKLGN